MHCVWRDVIKKSARLHSCFLSMRCCSVKRVMRVLPQPVVVVTSSMVHASHGTIKRGVTCSSFTCLTLEPPTVVVSIYNGNVINNFINSSGHFAVNILSHKQVKAGMHFARSLSPSLDYDQFIDIKHSDGVKGAPLLAGSAGIIQCTVSKTNVVGDHHVWYGTALEADANSDTDLQPMLYYQRAFRSIGDEIFMQAFENTKLPYEEWTHEAHLRMAWNYIIQHGREIATPLIKQGIMNYNEQNKEKITLGYNETVTMFYISVISKAISSMPAAHTFEEFLEHNGELTTHRNLTNYYSPEVLSSSESKHTFIQPDIQPLP